MDAAISPSVGLAGSKSGLRKIAGALRHRRDAAARCLMRPLERWDKFSPSLASLGVDSFIEWTTIPLVDYLVNYLHDDDPNWRDLFIGERVKQLHLPGDSIDQLIERHERVFAADRDGLLSLLSPQLSAEELQPLAQRLDWALELVTAGARSSRDVNILLVGDCLFLEVCTFLSVRLLEQGLNLRPIYVTSKNPVGLRSELRGLAKEPFDLVCYSPYSYEFSPLLSQTHYAKGMFSSRGALTKLAAEAHRQIAPTLRLLQEQFNCNVFVHNTGNIRRHNSTVASYFKNFVTAVARKRAAKEVNELLAVEVADLNAAASHPVVLIDEPALVATHGELALGRKFYDSEPQHPTNLALRFAEIYTGIASAVVQLLGRKVVVVDLDNTVWAGVIGEGSIVHDHRRQRVLQSLRQKGVLLAIASKNDAKNVHWTGGTLKENDFVASQINWDPKALNIKRIAEDLNIKLKDFVFIDDRPDEREMVRMSIPGIHCLDATDEFTWKMLDWWAETLPEQSDADRTQMYLERRQRQAHLDQPSEKEDPQELLSSLGLKLQIRPVMRKELVRATELINRTNQFNTCGSRVSERQMTTWSDSPDYHILVADAADRFGTMGIVSVMIIQQVEDALEIPVWVLSCRVFGFSIESVMLNQVRRIAQRSGISVVRGLFVETPNNQPCRDVYSTDGFTAIGGGWELTVSGLKPDPPWLSITTIEKPSASLGRR